jgi:hypothetical protein
MIYLLELRKLSYIKYRRINILIDGKGEPRISGEHAKVRNVVFPYDVAEYFNLKSDAEKKIVLLNVFHESLIFLADKLCWEKQDFIRIRDKVLLQNFEYSREWKRYKCRGKEQVYAYLEGQVMFDHIKYIVRFEKNNVLIHSQEIYEGISNWIYWDTLFKKFTWIDKETFEISNNKNTVFFNCNYITGNFTISVDTERRLLAENELKKCSFYTSSEERNHLVLLDFAQRFEQ